MASLLVTRHGPEKSVLPPVWVTYIAHRGVWLLVEEYRVKLDFEDEMVHFEIPKDFEFDLASVPRILWPLIGSFELSLIAPLIHDYLYQTTGKGSFHYGETEEGVTFQRPFTRKEADDIFLDLMLREGVPLWRARSAHRAVRWFAPRREGWPK